MKQIQQLIQSPNVPPSIQFQLKYSAANCTKTYYAIAEQLELLDGYLNSKHSTVQLNELSLSDLVNEFPHLANHEHKLDIVKSGHCHLFGLYVMPLFSGAYQYSDMINYCQEKNIVILTLSDKPILLVDSISALHELEKDIIDIKIENEVVFWLKTNGYLNDSSSADTGESTEIAITDYVHEEPYFLAIADSNEISEYLVKAALIPLPDKPEREFEDLLPENTIPFVELLHENEKTFTHRLSFKLEDDYLVPVSQYDIEGTSQKNRELYEAFKSLCFIFQISLLNIKSTPIADYLVVSIPESHHNSEAYECGVKIRTMPTNTGCNILIEAMYSSEFCIDIETKQINAIPSKVNVAYGAPKSEPSKVMCEMVRSYFSNNPGGKTIAVEDNFPIYIDDISHLKITSNLTREVFTQYSSMGVESLIIGEINSDKLANIALIAASCGLTVFAFCYGASSNIASNKIKFIQTEFDSSQANTISDLVEMIGTNSTDDRLE